MSQEQNRTEQARPSLASNRTLLPPCLPSWRVSSSVPSASKVGQGLGPLSVLAPQAVQMRKGGGSFSKIQPIAVAADEVSTLHPGFCQRLFPWNIVIVSSLPYHSLTLILKEDLMNSMKCEMRCSIRNIHPAAAEFLPLGKCRYV